MTTTTTRFTPPLDASDREVLARLTPLDRRILAITAGCSPRTIDRLAAGGGTTSTTRARVLAAIAGLGHATTTDRD